MRAHFSPEIPGGELPVRMNSSNQGGPFGVIELGRSEICLDTVEDARALLAAAARVVAWFETPCGPHAFESMDGAGIPYGSCVHCGQINRSEPHAAPAAVPDAPITAGTPLLVDDEPERAPVYGCCEHCDPRFQHGAHRMQCDFPGCTRATVTAASVTA